MSIERLEPLPLRFIAVTAHTPSSLILVAVRLRQLSVHNALYAVRLRMASPPKEGSPRTRGVWKVESDG